MKKIREIKESFEIADITNKIQAVIDYVCEEQSSLEDLRDYFKESNNVLGEKTTNDNMKANFVVISTLLAIIRDYENELSELDVIIKKANSIPTDQSERENA